MVSRLIELDEETDRLLSELAQECGGDLSRAVAFLVHVREGLEDIAEQAEAASRVSLTAQLKRAERGFREGHFTTWEDVKRQNGL
jgi:hypothetical protein